MRARLGLKKIVRSLFAAAGLAALSVAGAACIVVDGDDDCIEGEVICFDDDIYVCDRDDFVLEVECDFECGGFGQCGENPQLGPVCIC